MPVELGSPIFSCICEEKVKQSKDIRLVERSVYELIFTPDNLMRLWEKASQFRALFWEDINGDFKKFLSLIMSQEGSTVKANGLFWVIDDFVGVYYMNNINWCDAQIHYSFFDKRHSGRHRITRAMIKYVFDNFRAHRLSAEIPRFQQGTFEFIKQVGLKQEGVKRESVWYKDQWYDVELWSILKSETDAWDFPKEMLKWA
jgi:RimJ/RimL family protein N-acetyltransferase